MSEETIKLSIQTPTVDDGGLKTIRAYVQSLDRFHKLAQKPITIRVETQGLDRAQQALERARQTGMKALSTPASVPKNSPYLASLQTHLTAVSRYTDEFHVSMAKLKAGFRSPEQKIGFLTSVEEQINRVGKSAKNFNFRQPADREGFFDSLKSASNMIKLESEAMHAAQVEAMKSKEDAKVFQAPDERKGAARGKTDALTAADKNLAAATGQAKHGIVEQDRALLAKIETLRTTTVATDALSRSEKKLATSAASSAGAERGALIKRVERDGTLKSRTYAVAPGVTQVVSPGATGDSTTVTTDKMAELRNRVKETNEEFSRLLTKRKAEGAGVREVSAIYAQQANALDKLSSEYRAIDDATGRMVARQAESARVKSGATRSTAARKAETDDQKKSLKDGMEFQKRMESTKWAEIQKIEDRAKAIIAGKSAAGAPASDISRDYEQMAKEIDSVSKKFKSPEDSMEAARRAASFRSKGHQIQLRSDAAAWQNLKTERARANKEAIQQAASHQLAMDTFSDMKTRGFKESNRGRQRTVSGSREVIDFTKENGSMRENVRLMVERDARGRILNATSAETSKALAKTAENTGYLTKNFLQNTATVAVWAASVGALYGTLGLVRSGMEAAVNYDRKFSALTVVFRGTENQAAQLRDEVLLLAAAYGQSGGEALDAAIRFSRLGMSQAQTLEAVRASLMAANVAEMGVGEAADALAAIMATFNLEAKDLVGVINRLNAISNTYNVTNKDMIGGLARVGSVARTSGLSLEETMGTIAAVSRRTGRSGAEAGNALKAVIVSLANPTKQKNLSDMFQFSVSDQTGELKSMSDVLRDLYLRYQDLTSAEQQHLLQVVAGKQQASRLAAMIDGYVDSQLMAIRSVTNLDSAEKENARIKQSLLVQLKGLSTAYETMSYSMATSGGNFALIGTLRELTIFLKNVLNLMGSYSNVSGILIGFTGLLAARMGVTALRLAEMGKQYGFVTNSGKALTAGIANLGLTFKQMSAELVYSGTRMMPFTRGMIGATGATRGLGVAAAFTAGAIKALASATLVMGGIYAVITIINSAVEAHAGGWEKAQQKLAGFNEELERLTALAEGNRLSQRLAETILARLRTGKVSPQDRENFIAATSEAFSGGDASKQIRISQDMQAGYRQGGDAGLQVSIQQHLNVFKKEGVRLTQEKNAAESLGLKQAKENIRLAQLDLAAAQRNEAAHSKSASAKNKSAEAAKRLQEAQQKFNDIISKKGKSAAFGDDPEAANESERQEELRAQKQKSRIEKMMESYQKAAASAVEGFSTLGPVDKAQMQIASIDAQITAIKSYRAEIEKKSKADIASAESAVADARANQERHTSYVRTLSAIEKVTAVRAKLQQEMDAIPESQVLLANKNGNKEGDISVPKLGNRAIKNQMRVGLEAIDANLSNLQKKKTDLESVPDIFGASKAYSDAQANADNITRSKLNELQITQETSRAELEKLEVQRRQLEIEMKVAAILEAQQAGHRRGDMSVIPLQYGNDTQKILRERRVLTSSSPVRDNETGMAMNIRAANQDFEKSSLLGDEIGQTRALEQMRTMALRVQEQEFTLLQRKLTIEAAIHEETRKTNIERSRSLIMGDREMQLRAAMAEKLGKKKGGFNAEDFMFLNPETKQSLSQTNPGLLPPEMRTELQQLREEFDLSKKGVASFTSGMESLRQTLEMIEKLRVDQKGQGKEAIPFDSKDILGRIEQGGATLASALKQIGDATYEQMMKLATVATDNARRIRQISIGDPASNAQSAVPAV